MFEVSNVYCSCTLKYMYLFMLRMVYGSLKSHPITSMTVFLKILILRSFQFWPYIEVSCVLQMSTCALRASSARVLLNQVLCLSSGFSSNLGQSNFSKKKPKLNLRAQAKKMSSNRPPTRHLKFERALKSSSLEQFQVPPKNSSAKTLYWDWGCCPGP